MIFAAIGKLRRQEASEYLKAKHGISRAPATLAKLAVLGGGPRFAKAGRWPIYNVDDLDCWATMITGPVVNSTAELRTVKSAA